MCQALYEIMKEDIDKREAKVKADAADENTVSNLKSMMETLKLTSQQAMDALRVPAGKREMYAARLQPKSAEMT